MTLSFKLNPQKDLESDYIIKSLNVCLFESVYFRVVSINVFQI